jgi:hypothetical protein
MLSLVVKSSLAVALAEVPELFWREFPLPHGPRRLIKGLFTQKFRDEFAHAN